MPKSLHMILEHLQFTKMGRLAGLGCQVELGQTNSFALHLVRDCLCHFFCLLMRIQYSNVTGFTLLG